MSVTVGSTGHPFTLLVFLKSVVVICAIRLAPAKLYLQRMQHILSETQNMFRIEDYFRPGHVCALFSRTLLET
jgi:hypothetical protein